MSRPNLSAVERGNREVTLGTLRRLALALESCPVCWPTARRPPRWMSRSGGRLSSALLTPQHEERDCQ